MNPQLEQLIALVRRYPWAIVCAVITIVCGGGAWYLHMNIADLAGPYAQRAKEYEDMLNLTKGGLTQRQELENLREFSRRIDENLVIEESIFENSRYFYSIEKQTGAAVAEPHQINSPVDTTPLFRRIPYVMRVTGSYEQVSSFIYAVETGPRLAKIMSFTISRSSGSAREGSRDAGRSAGGETPKETAPGVVLDLSLELLGKK